MIQTKLQCPQMIEVKRQRAKRFRFSSINVMKYGNFPIFRFALLPGLHPDTPPDTKK